MVGFGRNREITILFGLLLTVVDAKTPSSGSTWAGGSLTASAFVGPPKRLVQYGHFNERRSFTVNGDRSDSPKIWCPPRGFVSLRAMPVPDEEMEQRKEQLRDLLCASDEKIDKLVNFNPDILNRRNVVESHGPKVALLQKRLGISQKVAGKIFITSKFLLNSSLSTLEGKIDWLQERLNLNKAQLRKMIEHSPDILALSVDDSLGPSIGNIQTGFQLNDKDLSKFIVLQPGVLRQKTSFEKLSRRIPFLQGLLNIKEDDLATLQTFIVKHPAILFCPEDRMVEVQRWMKDRLGLDEGRIARMCQHLPHLLSMKVCNLEEKALWFQSAFLLTDDELGPLLGKFPSFLAMKVEENLEPKVRYLRKRFQLDYKDLKHLPGGFFSLSEGNIEEKLQLYSSLVGKEEAKRMVIQSTGLLVSTGLEHLKSRLAEVEKSGIKVKWDRTLIQ